MLKRRSLIKGLIRDDDALIGFVIDALYERAINISELRDWAIHIVVNNNVNDIPMYIIDLMDFSGYVKDIDKIIGFCPGLNCSKQQSRALYGIAVKRGRSLAGNITTDDEIISDAEALQALKKHPEIERRFREAFPFIDFN